MMAVETGIRGWGETVSMCCNKKTCIQNIYGGNGVKSNSNKLLKNIKVRFAITDSNKWFSFSDLFIHF